MYTFVCVGGGRIHWKLNRLRPEWGEKNTKNWIARMSTIVEVPTVTFFFPFCNLKKKEMKFFFLIFPYQIKGVKRIKKIAAA